MIPGLSIAFMIVALICGIAIPAALFFVGKKKLKVPGRPYLTGCIMYFVFVVVLGPLIQGLIVSSPFGAGIQGNFLLAALFFGITAALFEEGAKLFAFKYFLNKDTDNDNYGIMYAAGQGAFEAFYVIVSQIIGPLVVAFTVNSGKIQTLLEGQSAENAEAIKASVDALASTPPSTFMILVIARIPNIILCFAMTMFVWYAVKKQQYSLFLVAVFMHTMVSAASILLTALISSTIIIEMIIVLICLAYLFVAFLMYKNEHMGEKKIR